MRGQNAEDPYFVCFQDRRRATLLAHAAQDRRDALSFGLRQLQLIEEPGKGLIAPTGRRATLSECCRIDAQGQRPGREHLDPVIEDGDAGRVRQLVIAMRQCVAHRFVKRPLRVFHCVRSPRVRFVERSE
jgi:hypothetical protein